MYAPYTVCLSAYSVLSPVDRKQNWILNDETVIQSIVQNIVRYLQSLQ